jgi:hypothetical protein
MAKYLVTVPIATAYRKNKDGVSVIHAEYLKGRTVDALAIGEEKTPSGNFLTLILPGGVWIKKSDTILSTSEDEAKQLIANEARNASVTQALARSSNSTPTQIPNVSRGSIPTEISSTTAPKSYGNIIIGVLAIGLVLGLLKWKKVI